MVLTAFILLIIISALLMPISFMAAAVFSDSGFSISLRVRLAHLITLFGWDSGEEGFKFLFKKRVQEKKKKKRRLDKIVRRIFSPDSMLNMKGMTIAKFEARGRISTHDAANTALIYGILCAIISIIIPFLNKKRTLVDFYPDFQEKKPDFRITCIIRVRIIHIIYLIANFFREKYLKGRWHSLWNRILLKN